MKILKDLSGVKAPTTAYPKGYIEDGTTVIGEGINQDIVQFLQKLAIDADITENDLPENVTNGYQLIEALNYFCKFFLKTDGTGVVYNGASNEIDLSGLSQNDYRRIVLAGTTGGGQVDTISGEITSGDYTVPELAIYLADDFTFTDDDNIYLNGAEEVTMPSGSIIKVIKYSGSWHIMNYIALNADLEAKTPSFQNGYTAFGSVTYKKTASGEVIINGAITRPSSPGSGIIFTLPEGYRPATSSNIFICGAYDGSTRTRTEVFVDSSGYVEWIDYASYGTNDNLWFPGIIFST